MDEAVIAVDGRLIYQGSQATQSHRIWSATKTFTSTVVGILIDDKKINIDQKASELLPWMNKNYPEVTLEHLLTMQSGYLAEGSRYRVDEGGDGSKTPWLSIEKKFSPAEQWSYSDDSVNILGFALSAAAQKNFAEIFIDRIARPLEMQNFNWEPPGPQTTTMALIFRFLLPLEIIVGLKSVPWIWLDWATFI